MRFTIGLRRKSERASLREYSGLEEVAGRSGNCSPGGCYWWLLWRSWWCYWWLLSVWQLLILLRSWSLWRWCLWRWQSCSWEVCKFGQTCPGTPSAIVTDRVAFSALPYSHLQVFWGWSWCWCIIFQLYGSKKSNCHPPSLPPKYLSSSSPSFLPSLSYHHHHLHHNHHHLYHHHHHHHRRSQLIKADLIFIITIIFIIIITTGGLISSRHTGHSSSWQPPALCTRRAMSKFSTNLRCFSDVLKTKYWPWCFWRCLKTQNIA